MLTAYFDDSNTSPNQKVAVVAGYLGSVWQWENFSSQWAILLEDFKVKSVRRSQLQHLRGDFSTWDKSRRDAFIKKAYRIINRFTYTPIGVAVATEDFNAIVPDRFKEIVGDIYGWCANVCEHHVMEWCNRHDYNDKVQYVFEGGTYGRGQIYEWFRAISRKQDLRKLHRYGDISFKSKETKPLQAADFIAYDLGRVGLDIRLGREREEVLQIYNQYIVKPKRESAQWIKYWDRERLKFFFDNWNWEEAPSSRSHETC